MTNQSKKILAYLKRHGMSQKRFCEKTLVDEDKLYRILHKDQYPSFGEWERIEDLINKKSVEVKLPKIKPLQASKEQEGIKTQKEFNSLYKRKFPAKLEKATKAEEILFVNSEREAKREWELFIVFGGIVACAGSLILYHYLTK